ncbi:MAG: choice-of-anchor J domain-containing protein [Anaerolineae bacterium]
MLKSTQRFGVLMLSVLAATTFLTLLTTSFATADIGTSRQAPEMANPILIKEGFEAAGIATAGDGWKAQDGAGGSAATWLPSSILSYDGSQSAVVKYPESGLDPVDTWLLSPAFTLNERGVVNFVTWGHKNICVNVDWCDLEVWLIKGETVGDSDDISLGLVDPEWTGIFSETHHTRIIPAGLGEVRVGFHYSSTDGSAVYLDAVEIRDLTADVMYEANVQGKNELPPVTSPVTTSASFAYNFSTHLLTTSVEIDNPNGEILASLQLVSGTAQMAGTAIHDYGVASGNSNVTHTSRISLTTDQEEALIRGSLFIRPVYLQGGAVPASAGRGHLVQKLPIEMGFEAGRVPADGWEMQDGLSGIGSAATWVMTTTDPYQGSHSAVVPYPGDDQISTWLISPPFDLEGKGLVEFASAATVFWCRDNNDNCDLEVWAIRGNVAGDSDDVQLGLADPDWPALPKEFEWTDHLMEIPAGLGPIRIGFHMKANKVIGGDKVYLDSIKISGRETKPEISVDKSEQTAFLGETVTYTVGITNNGNVPATYTVSTSGNSWNTTKSAATLMLDEGASGKVEIKVTVPADEEDGVTDSVTLMVTDQDDSTQYSMVQLKTEADIRPVSSDPLIFLPLIVR